MFISGDASGTRKAAIHARHGKPDAEVFEFQKWFQFR